MSSDLPSKNRLTYTADFDPDRTDWIFGCDNPILPLKPLLFSRAAPVRNPDGSGPAYLVSLSRHASQHGCIRKSFEPLMEVPGTIHPVQTLSAHFRRATSDYVSLCIYNRMKGKSHSVVWRWVGEKLELHSITGLRYEEETYLIEADHGWIRAGITLHAPGDEIGDVKNIMLRVTGNPEPVEAGRGSYVAQAQLEHGPEMTAYEEVKNLGRFAALLND